VKCSTSAPVQAPWHMLAAAKLEATRVCAIDRDVDALAAAADGRGRDGFAAKRVELRHADISTDVLGEFDLVIVNVEAAQIHAWADAIRRHVRPGGTLLLAGFLDAERDVVMRGFTPSEVVIRREDGWAAVLLNRPAP